MPLRDLLKKKDKIEQRNAAQSLTGPTGQAGALAPPAAPFKFVRSDTHSEEVINPPSFASDIDVARLSGQAGVPPSPPSPRSGIFRGSSRNSSERDGSPHKEHRRLSQRLYLSMNKSRSSSTHSINLPSNLPDIPDAYSPRGDQQEKEAGWEQRATLLANTNRPRTPSSVDEATAKMAQLETEPARGRPSRASDAESDITIQDAIRAHEEGRLTEAAEMFKTLADDGNVLSAVLYGLSLRHGWGLPQDEAAAFTYLSSAASNSAALETEALNAGLKKGGAAKGKPTAQLARESKSLLKFTFS